MTTKLTETTIFYGTQIISLILGTVYRQLCTFFLIEVVYRFKQEIFQIQKKKKKASADVFFSVFAKPQTLAVKWYQ